MTVAVSVVGWPSAVGLSLVADRPAIACSTVTTVVVVCSLTALVAVTMAAGWIGYRFCAPPPQESSPAPRKVMVAATTQPVDEVLPSAGAGTGESPAASWTGAQRAYAAKEYQQALEQYRQLAAMTASAPGRAVVHELFELRAADCLQKIGTSQDYRQQLSLVG